MSDPIEIEVSQSQPISVSVTSPSQVGVNVSGGVGPQGPAGPTGPQGPPGDSANLPAGNQGDVLTYSSGEWVAAAPAGAFLPLAGGAMNSGAVVTLSNGTSDSEVGGWGFGVELTGGTNQFATVEYNALTVQDGSGSTVLGPGRLTLPNSTQVTVGSFDNMTGGANGISLICSVGYELNWQGGRLRSVQVGGDGTPQTIYSDSQLAFPGGAVPVRIDSTGITFADGSTQTAAAPALPQSLGQTDNVQFASVTAYGVSQPSSELNIYGLRAGTNSSLPGTNYYNDGITFADSSFQDTAWTGSVDWGTQVTGKPTLFDGAYSSLTGVPSTFAPSAHNQAWSTITSTPTTLGGYGITNGVTTSDSRLSDARTPTGSAGGDLTGTYPNPQIAAGAVTEADLANAVRNQLVHPFLLAGM